MQSPLLKITALLYFGTICILTSACGGGGGGSSEPTDTSTILSGLLFPIRVGELDSKNLIVAELSSGRLFTYNKETKVSTDLEILAPFTGSGLGISGLLVDKDFDSNGYVFVYHGTGESGRNVLTRFTLKDLKVNKRQQLLLLTPPSGHNGGGMYQLSNGNILLGIGDGGNPAFSPNKNKQEGKILILNRDGQYIDLKNNLPSGIYALGFRNPFGISGRGDNDIFIADNGPDCDDEINKLASGANYGWREGYVCGKQVGTNTPPIYSWSPSQGITDILYTNDNTILASHYNTNTLVSLKLNGDRTDITEERVVIQNGEEPIIDLLQTKDGEILYTTPSSVAVLAR